PAPRTRPPVTRFAHRSHGAKRGRDRAPRPTWRPHPRIPPSRSMKPNPDFETPHAFAAGQSAFEQAEKVGRLLTEDEDGARDAGDRAGAADRRLQRSPVLVEV